MSHGLAVAGKSISLAGQSSWLLKETIRAGSSNNSWCVCHCENVHELVLEAVCGAIDTDGARLLYHFHEVSVLALCFLSWVVGLFTSWFCLSPSPKSHVKEVVRHRSRCQRAVAVRSHRLESFRTRVEVFREMHRRPRLHESVCHWWSRLTRRFMTRRSQTTPTLRCFQVWQGALQKHRRCGGLFIASLRQANGGSYQAQAS